MRGLVPGSFALKTACIGDANVGTNVIYRYVDGELTAEPLWNPAIGEFPHGATVLASATSRATQRLTCIRA